jgi:anti-anti-sigma factor
MTAAQDSEGHDDGSSGMSLEERPGSTLVRLWGEIDLDVRRSAGDACQAAADRALPVVVDAEGVTFMDSTGMSILVRMARDAEAGGYPLELHNPPWILRELLSATGVDQLLTLVLEGGPGEHDSGSGEASRRQG